jgi:anti-anti-sigma regulatory factor
MTRRRASLGWMEFAASECDRRAEYRCCSCAYGAATLEPPEVCPMCAATSWTYEPTAPGSPTITVRRIRDSAFVLTPPGQVDASCRATLVAAVASLAHEQPEILVDLSSVRSIDPETVELLERLATLARGAGGRLLATYPSGAESEDDRETTLGGWLERLERCRAGSEDAPRA